MKVKSLQRVLDEAGLGEDYVHRHLQQHLELQRHPGGRVTGVSFGGTTPEANYVTVCAGPSALPKRQVRIAGHVCLSSPPAPLFSHRPLVITCLLVSPQEILLRVWLLRAVRLRALWLAALQRPLLEQPRRDTLPEILPVIAVQEICGYASHCLCMIKLYMCTLL